ncbi:hypothetical protein E4U50_007163 [Claviceps purpurea]|nr:hypothetical protein E4U36_003967 [Claviceps purpurea]KAG6219049.1 hypothetical protein E4U50_007163 [Claviceps purpurea]
MVQLCLPEAVQLLPYKLPDSRRGGVQAEPPDAAQCPEAAEAADTATRNQRTGRADPTIGSARFVHGRGVLQPPAEPSTDSPYRLQIADSPRLAGNRRSTVHTTPA